MYFMNLFFSINSTFDEQTYLIVLLKKEKGFTRENTACFGYLWCYIVEQLEGSQQGLHTLFGHSEWESNVYSLGCF